MADRQYSTYYFTLINSLTVFLSGTYIYSLFICSLQFILIQYIVYSNLEIKTMLVAVYFAYYSHGTRLRIATNHKIKRYL